MANLGNNLIPGLFLLVVLYALWKKTDVFSTFLQGAAQGFTDTVEILSYGIGPLLAAVGLPKEVYPLALLRPLSGSGALVIFQDILSTCGADSFAGQVASTMMGSTETTFYTIAMYLGAAKITKTRYCVPAALAADISGMIMSAVAVRLLLTATL